LTSEGGAPSGGDIAAAILRHVTADDYARENPEIDDPNVFSVSTLAWDWERQARFKCMRGPHVRAAANFDMFRGKAVHEFLQKRFVAEGWVAELKLSEYLDVYVGDRRVRLIGHVDLYEPSTGTVLELKSSVWSDGIAEGYIVQAGTYAAMLRNARFRVGGVHVAKINSKVTVYTLSEDDVARAYATVVGRARLAADAVTKCLNSPTLDSYRDV